MGWMADRSQRTVQRLGVGVLVAAVVAAVVGAGLLLAGLVPTTHHVGGAGAAARTAPGADPTVGTAPAPVGAMQAPASPSDTGTATQPAGPLTIVALGDSVPAAATCGCAGYVDRLGDLLRPLTQRDSDVRNDAVGGWTTSDLWNDLASSDTRADLAHADLVVVEIGANDFDLGRVDDTACFPAASSSCWSDPLAKLRAGLLRIIPAIRALDSNPALSIAVAGYWNVTVDGSVGRAHGPDFVTGSDALTRLVNSTIADVTRRSGAIYVDAYTPFKGESGTRDTTDDLLADGDHPNAKGHALLSHAFLDSLVVAGAVTGWTSR